MDKLATEKPIVIIGFMAVGKTTVGRLLADRLGWSFVDTDAEISRKEGRSIEQIFAEDGEAYFRRLEAAMIKELVAHQRIVISTGGGLPCNALTSEVLAKSGQTVHISLGVDKIWQRLTQDRDRPLVIGKSSQELRKFIRAKLTERNHYYNKAQLRVMGHGSPVEIVDRIIRKLKRNK